MSGSHRIAFSAPGRWIIDARSARVLRYAMGSTIALTVAMAWNWPIAYLTPLLSLKFLASPKPRPSLKVGIGFIVVVGFSCLGGLWLGRYLISYPLVYIPFTGLVLFRIFHLKTVGKAPGLMTMLLISLLVLPLIVMTTPAAAEIAAGGILMAAIATIGVVWLAHALIPDTATPIAVPGTGQTAPELATPLAREEQYRRAMISTLVVLPVFIVFYALQLTGLMVVLIFVAVLASQPEFATNFKIGAALIIGNVLGGLSAILFYELLVIVPAFPFLISLTFLAGLVFGNRVFSDEPVGKLFGMGYSTLLLVIGSVTASGSDEASSMVYLRVAQISVAVIYCVLAFGVADRFVRRKEG